MGKETRMSKPKLLTVEEIDKGLVALPCALEVELPPNAREHFTTVYRMARAMAVLERIGRDVELSREWEDPRKSSDPKDRGFALNVSEGCEDVDPYRTIY
jgi:hypothetical protein